MLSRAFTIFGLIALLDSTLALTSGANGRVLYAATKRSHIESRSATFELSNEAMLVYADGGSTTSAEQALHFKRTHTNSHEDSNVLGETAYTGTVRLYSKKPILVLEEMEDWLSTIRCNSNSITLSKAEFMDDWTLSKVNSLIDGHIITSHTSCNDDHERVAYRVTGVEALSGETVTIRVTSAPWKASFESIKLEFGYTNEIHELRAHKEMRRSIEARQDDSSSDPNAILTAAVPSLPQETPTAVATDAPTSTQLDVAATLINQKIDIPGERTDTAAQFTCVRCETAGTIDITAANFQYDANLLDDGHVSLSGDLTATANGLKAHIELATSVQDNYEFMAPLGPFGQSHSINIPGVGAAQLKFGGFIAGGYTLNGTVALNSYGLTMEVPSGATAGISIDTTKDDELNATQSLFDQTTFTALPLNSQVQISAMSFWLAYRTTLQASFSFQDDGNTEDNKSGINLRAGIFFDDPILNATVTALSNVNENCESGGNFQDVVNVNYSVGWNFGIYGAASALGSNLSDSFYYPGSLFTAPPAQCLQYDGGAKSYNALSGVEDAAGRVGISVVAIVVAVGAMFALY